ncbi:MFS transporter [Pseudonocardia parietis]|uniref:EmrB/QacA subfamily drug resistance transporter n=1 Tax=Pseudonocardia parietis TaxID=570936 RepID=A0ABS4W4Y1_9PSEU|nr:MFS transporter [Pseudonocardia parietis]MBP2371241.1 EmrB/QacA subfamily drug resistance transporter [Pseudonocardia parietis]
MAPPVAASGRSTRRWFALAVLAGSQLLIVLDATIVNVALTDMQDDLDLAPTALHWVVTGYVLAFGGFLLLGGRLADRVGRRRMFIVGATVFGTGSLLAGLAETAVVLFGGRVIQGLAAAVLAPATLSLLMTVFPPGRDRNLALGVWGGVSASGTALGLILGGILTEALSWEWVFWVNVPIAAIAVVSARVVLPDSSPEQTERFDLAGGVLATAGLAGLVYGLVQAAESGWTSVPALLVLVLSVLALLAFARVQAVRPHALVPLPLIRNPTVLGGNLVGLILGAAIYALFYFLSLFMGGTLGYEPVAVGLAFLPMTAAIAVASTAAGKLLARTGARSLLVASALLVTAALASLSRIAPDSTYLSTLLPAAVLAGSGLGLAFVALTTTAIGSATPRDSGVAAALFNAGQQVGGAIGLAVLTAVSTARTASLTPEDAGPSRNAITQGWSLGFLVSAGIMSTGLLITLVMIKDRRPNPVPRQR